MPAFFTAYDPPSALTTVTALAPPLPPSDPKIHSWAPVSSLTLDPEHEQTHDAKVSIPRPANTPMMDQPKATINANPAKKVGSKIEPQVNNPASQKSKPSQPPTKTIQPNSNPKAGNNAKQDSDPKQDSNPKPQPYSVPKEGSDPHQASDPNHSSDPRLQHNSNPTQGSNPNSASDPKPQQNSIATQGNDPNSGSDPTQGSDPHQGSNPKQDNGKNGDSGQAAESKPNNDSDQVDTIEESNRNTALVVLSDANQTENANSLNDFTEALASNAPGTITTTTADQAVTANGTMISLNTAAQLMVGTKTIALKGSSGENAGLGGSIMGAFGTGGPFGTISSAPGQGNASMGGDNRTGTGVHVFNGGAASSKGWELWKVMVVAVIAMFVLAFL